MILLSCTIFISEEYKRIIIIIIINHTGHTGVLDCPCERYSVEVKPLPIVE